MADATGLVYSIDGAGLFLGTGIGLRYSTVVGALRLDAGVPLDRHSGVDDIFQIYVSIGQAY